MGLARLLPREQRTVTAGSFGFNEDSWRSAQSWAGGSVSYDTAMTLSTVFACVTLQVDDISTLPVDTFIRRDGVRTPFRPKPAWVDLPDPDGVNRVEHFAQVVASMLLTHGACTRVYRNDVGEPVALENLDPTRVQVRRNPSTRKREFVWDGTTVLSNRDVLYVPRFVRPGQVKGLDPLAELRQSLALSRALDEFAARFFANGSITSGVIEIPATVTREQAKEALDVFEETHKGASRAHRPAVLGGGATFNKTGVDPENAQMLESRQFSVEEIARIFRVPLHMLQVAAPGVQSYDSNEQNEIQYVGHTLRSIVTKIEIAYSSLLPVPGAFLRFNLDALIRGDIATRFAAYSSGIDAGWMTAAEAREKEDLKPIEGADRLRVPLENVDISAAQLKETQARVAIFRQLTASGVDPADAAKVAGLPPMKNTKPADGGTPE